MAKATPPNSVAAARIGGGVGYFVVGGVAIAIGALGTLAAAGGAVGAGQVGGAFLDLGGLFVVLGLGVRLLGALERRLIDIQRAVIWAAPEPPSSAGSPRV